MDDNQQKINYVDPFSQDATMSKAEEDALKSDDFDCDMSMDEDLL